MKKTVERFGGSISVKNNVPHGAAFVIRLRKGDLLPIMNAMLDDENAIIEIKGLTKSFPGVKALENVDFTLKQGEILGLVGENGAGKSTLIKTITGIYKKDAGEIFFRGKPFEVSSPVEAQKSGISTVYQEVNLIPELSVAENIYLGREPLHMGSIIDWKSIHSRAREAIRRLDVDVDVTQPVSSYSIAIQQLVAVTRALDMADTKVLILDEPTSSLDAAEVKQLFTVLRRLKEDGISIVFITHFLEQLYDITDRITILRNGKLVGQYKTKKLTRIDLISKMLGKELKRLDIKGSKQARDLTDKKLFYSVRNLERKGEMSAFDLDIYKGEILGLAGLLGSGRTEIAQLLFGSLRPHHGKSFYNEKEIKLNSTRQAIKLRFGYCPEDRKNDGLFPTLTVRENILLAVQAKRGLRILPRNEQEEIVNKYIDILGIKTPDIEQDIDNLSGGNQQKVIVARWLATNPEFLILDEPTRGIDIGSKADIQDLIVELSNAGMAILFISSEIEEVVRCSDRVAVLRDRQKLTELSGSEIEEENIMHIIAAH